ncbi:putative pentamidine resistance factor, mitochondrial precursor [Scheffersomyces coipomensis]|uniref:putative pentamidine resistance factor, mitochondrial precursor n=1 Tax=Scheffersomyces coipomensis TaxID=1788519 RepID=UPI00315DC22B
MSRTGKALTKAFYEFPARRNQFLQELQTTETLKSLWAASKQDNYQKMNSIVTIPAPIKSKEDIYEEIKNSNPEILAVSLKWKQGIAFAKSLATFYKEGLSRVSQGRKLRRSILSNMKLINQVDSRGNGLSIGIRNFKKLTLEMSQVLYINDIQNSTKSQEFIKRENNKDNLPLFNLTRSEYQVLKRAPSNTNKIPLFAVLALIFMESTPLLCYFVPEVAPSTCVLPSILPSLWNVSASKKLDEIRSKRYDSNRLVDLSLKTAYNLPLDEAKVLAKSLRLVPRMLPSVLVPELVVRRILQNYYNYLLVDNYYLSGANDNGNIWDLGEEELVIASLERNLILDLKSDLKYIGEGKTLEERRVRKEEYLKNLRLRLLVFLVDFKNYNIGYLGVNHMLKYPIDEKVIAEWRDLQW